MDKKIIIAIDGHSGCGKSSTAKAVARKLEYVYVDTGAMYRAVTLHFLRKGVDSSDAEAVESALKDMEIAFQLNPKTGLNEVYLNGTNIEHEIRELRISEKVSEVSALTPVRKKMVALQKKMGKTKGLVMDGRDIGTVVFPEAELKIFMTAELPVRAARRLEELKQTGKEATLEEVLINLSKRDEIDSSREDSPLMKAEDAIIIDTSCLTFEDQTEKVVTLARKKISGN